MQIYTADESSPALLLAHGAGAGEEHPWMRRVAAALASHGVNVMTFNFPYREEGRKVPDRTAVLEAAVQSAWAALCDAYPNARAYVAGGKSMGGRMASHVAAKHAFAPPAAGLVFFGYPLHPPGKPDQKRDQHLPAISAPMLFLHGTRDPFGTADEMRALTETLPSARLELVDDGDHSLVAPRRSDPKGQSVESAVERAATWIHTVCAR
jgi:predicted alpha/beta-hydrolase family hydrolase